MERGSRESALKLSVPANASGQTEGSEQEKEIKRERICQVRACETGEGGKKEKMRATERHRA